MWTQITDKLTELSNASRDMCLGAVEQGFPVSNETIAKIEKILGVSLPYDYVQFLQRYGAIGFGDAYFYGTWSSSDDDIRGTTVVGETLRLRKKFSMPHDLVAVFGSDYESYLCLNCSNIVSAPALVYFSVSQGAVFSCDHSSSFVNFLGKYLDALVSCLREDQ